MFTFLSSNVQDDRTSLLPNVYKMYIKTNFVAKKVCKLQAENSVNMCMYHSALGSASVRNPGVRMALSLVSYMYPSDGKGSITLALVCDIVIILDRLN